MNEQYSGERFNAPYGVESAAKDTSGPIAGVYPVADEVPMETPLAHETPMAGALVYEAQPAEMKPYKAPIGDSLADEAERSKSLPYVAPTSDTITHEAPVGTNAGSPGALLTREESEHFRTRWNEIQGMFVDEPRSAVQQADGLVSEVVEQITLMFATERSTLEKQWKQGSDVSTEDLRRALQRYRSFFNRLVI
jgi:hypothetical protein